MNIFKGTCTLLVNSYSWNNPQPDLYYSHNSLKIESYGSLSTGVCWCLPLKSCNDIIVPSTFPLPEEIFEDFAKVCMLNILLLSSADWIIKIQKQI